MILVGAVLVFSMSHGYDVSGLMAAFTGLAVAFGVRVTKGAVDRDYPAARKAEKSEVKENDDVK